MPTAWFSLSPRGISLLLILSVGLSSDLPWAAGQEPDRAGQESSKRKPKLLLLSQGPDGHPPKTHEYDAGLRIVAHLLARHSQLDVETLRADSPWEEGPEKLRQAEGAVLFLAQGAKWIHEEPRRLEAFAQLAAKGGGLTVLHWGMGTKEAGPIEGFLKLWGGCHGGPDRKYLVLETVLAPVAPRHEIATGVEPLRVHDEFYYSLKFAEAGAALRPVMAADIQGRSETVAWAWERGNGGRSFGFSGLHFHRNWDHPEYRRLVVQGILWTMKIPIPATGVAVDLPEKP